MHFQFFLRCDANTVTCERPSTRERTQGRVPMAVLQPRPEYYPLDAANDAVLGAATAEGDGGTMSDQQLQEQGDQSTRTNRSVQQQQQQELSAQSRGPTAKKAGLPFKVRDGHLDSCECLNEDHSHGGIERSLEATPWKLKCQTCLPPATIG